MKKRFLILCLSIILASAGVLRLLSFSASADAAPPAPPVGSNIPPDGLTNVRMVSETVTLDVQASTALVEAVFYMHNLGDTDEDMLVRFPLYQSGYDINSNECGEFPWFFDLYSEIQDFVVLVDGRPAPATKNYQEVFGGFRQLPNGDREPITKHVACWVHFPVQFPAGQDVAIKVSYTVDDYRIDDQSSYVEYDYVLETGRGWRDTIGQAEIVMRLPYDVTPMNLERCSPECTYSGSEIRWHFENFEPREKDNIWVSILAPAAWQKILTETRLTQANPKDGEAWGRLGKAYKEALVYRRSYRQDAAGLEMVALSEAAYEKAVTWLPGDADWHYGYADWLCWKAEWDHYSHPTLEAWQACAQQLRQALAINPEHEKANALLQDMQNAVQNQLSVNFADLSSSEPVFLILTMQPTATATPLPPTSSPTATRTQAMPTETISEGAEPVTLVKTALPKTPTKAVPTVEASKTPLPLSSPTAELESISNSSPLTGGVVVLALVLLAVVVIVVRRR